MSRDVTRDYQEGEMGNSKGLKLRCRDGRWEWAAWELTPVRGEDGALRYGMRTPCLLGDHWLAITADGTVQSVQTVALFPTPDQAEAVRAAWERQETHSAD
jgi:hypothetical protein